LTGYSAGEAAEGGLALILESDPGGNSPAEILATLVEEALEKGVYRGSVSGVRRDGRRIRLDLAMTVVRDYHTRTASVVCTARDVTNESELQAELRDARRLETVGAVASGVAHDLNNLLMVITAYSELGLQTLYCEHPLRRNLQEILAAAQRAGELTRQLLATGRGHIPGMHTVNLNSVVQETSQLLPQVLGEDIELNVSLGEGVGHIKGDAGQIERSLLNLAVNARDAMPLGGTFSVKTQVGAPAANGDDQHQHAVEYALLEVADSGQGISAEEIPKIFRPFYTTKADRNGNGLGLAVVERTVKQSGGFIKVESEVGKGTMFRRYFPLVAQTQEHPGKSIPTGNSVPQGSETVLVVEDDDAVRDSSTEFLLALGYKVLPAANGKDALELAARHPGKIDAMIADVVMPHMSGTQLAANLAESQPEMKVLFVSGHAESLVRRKGVEAEAQFLQRPYPIGLLAERLRKTLGRPAQARAAAAGAT
jgi:signal transduction histidine kinase